jgi:hypothetical protein
MDCPVKLSDDNTIAFYHLKLINTSDNFYTLGSGTLDRNGFNGTYNTS